MARSATIRMPIRWRDIDSLGHVNQSVYHELLEEGRGALFESLIEEHGSFDFVLARVELDYKREVRHSDGAVDVITSIERIGRSSVTLAAEIRLFDGTIAAEGRSVLVAWDSEGRRSRPLTEWEREQLA
ncbi:MAG TPA: thioesterase family protein [Solirubrobacter sp.]|jgi:acyl-CoA thioester hydrolase|nr:thioesterase family protein [Solirubrobacter sp.]